MNSRPHHLEIEDARHAQPAENHEPPALRRQRRKEELEADVGAVSQREAGAEQEEPDQQESRGRVDEIDGEIEYVARDDFERHHDREQHADREQTGFRASYDRPVCALPCTRQDLRLVVGPEPSRVIGIRRIPSRWLERAARISLHGHASLFRELRCVAGRPDARKSARTMISDEAGRDARPAA